MSELATTTIPAELLEAQALDHRLEMAKKDMQLVVYRQALVDAGIEPPDRSGEELLEMWQNCRHVVNVTHEFVMRLGTQKEFLVDWRQA